MLERGRLVSPSDEVPNLTGAGLSSGRRGSVPAPNRPLCTEPGVNFPGMPASHCCRERPVPDSNVIARNDQLVSQTKVALRRLASAVAVVTCRDGQTRHAMTATAVNAMSMQPPSMIVCVNRSGAFHAAISRASDFAINILHRNQVRVSMECGGKARGEDRFCFGGWARRTARLFFRMRRPGLSAPRKIGSTTVRIQFSSGALFLSAFMERSTR